MRTITTLRNGNIYEMSITEAIEIVQDYARLNTGGDLLQATEEMMNLADAGDLPIRQKVGIRRFVRDMSQLLAPAE
jgi:hypothetical protein